MTDEGRDRERAPRRDDGDGDVPGASGSDSSKNAGGGGDSSRNDKKERRRKNKWGD